ncbi:hypothetical protein TTRE_0000650201 [Trichuris trichiura]|uniref:Uncharacterized protein n=1 Tax=Trichuris trichiura TaxID=36087 RepID=A0A077ZCW4_TRITR|nr:hypothetical protein TTRE_0000650201 [Trichuris trichiura]
MALQCYYCSNSFAKSRTGTNMDCMAVNGGSHKTDNRMCMPSERWCKGTAHFSNGVLVEVQRDCSKNCKRRCEKKGYGVSKVKCKKCCNTTLCNNWRPDDLISYSYKPPESIWFNNPWLTSGTTTLHGHIKAKFC